MTTTAHPFREARAEDLVAVVTMLANDPLGQGREVPADPLPPAYQKAFAAIDADPNQHLLVADDGDGQVLAVLQLSFIPSLTYSGGTRAQIEGVRVHASMRGQGLGRRLLNFAIEKARQHGCCMVQLTTDKKRPDALRFYQGLGFVASHEGMKLHF